MPPASIGASSGRTMSNAGVQKRIRCELAPEESSSRLPWISMLEIAFLNATVR